MVEEEEEEMPPPPLWLWLLEVEEEEAAKGPKGPQASRGEAAHFTVLPHLFVRRNEWGVGCG